MPAGYIRSATVAAYIAEQQPKALMSLTPGYVRLHFRMTIPPRFTPLVLLACLCGNILRHADVVDPPCASALL